MKVSKLLNGLTLITEEMPDVESASLVLLMPGGVLSDTDETLGASLVLAELTARGAAELDSVQLSEAFDRIGARHGEGAGHDSFSYRASLLGENLEQCISLVSKMLLKPRLPEDEIDNIRNVFLQELAALSDNPSKRAIEELEARYFPAPFNRSDLGTLKGLKAIGISNLKESYQRCYRPDGAVLSIAGKINAKQVEEWVTSAFGEWQGKGFSRPKFGATSQGGYHHIEYEGAQLQIVLAYAAPPFEHPCYYSAKLALQVLSGGMFGRLFTEVREKRGLVYSVYARHASTKEYGQVMAYAGTTPERAQETYDVMMRELKGIKGTVSADELARAKANLKAALIMNQEAVSSRTSSSAHDYWLLGRVRSLDEIKAEIEKVSISDIDSFAEEFSVKNVTVVTLGPKKLDIA